MLYTGKGDKGTTKVLDSKERFSKGSDMAEALGSLDELNSFLGLCKFEARHMQEGGVAEALVPEVKNEEDVTDSQAAEKTPEEIALKDAVKEAMGNGEKKTTKKKAKKEKE